MNWIKKAWRGEERAVKAYVIYVLILGYFLKALVAFLTKGITGVGVAFALTNAVGAVPAMWLIYAIVLLSIFYSIWACTVAWKCAFNTEHPAVAYLVRVVAILSVLYIGPELYEMVKGHVPESINVINSCQGDMNDAQKNNQCICTESLDNIAKENNKRSSEEYLSKREPSINQCIEILNKMKKP